MRKIKSLFLTLGVMLPMMIMAQEPSLKVSAKQQVAVGESFQVVFEMNAEGKNFTAPSFEGFTKVGGPFSSSSSSVQMINGSVSRTVKNTYTYMLQANREGTFRIGPASYVVKGDKISSSSIEIKVVPDDGSGSSRKSSQGSQSVTSSSDPSVSGRDLFLKVVPSKKSVYLGEPLVLTYKIYTRVPVSSLSVAKMPAYAGFWTKDVSEDNGGALRQTSELVNGVDYQVAEIQKIVIVPQKVGGLPIEPMTIECVAQIQTKSSGQRSNDPFEAFFNDPFFGRGFTNITKRLESGSINITVKDLPSSGKPSSFQGAVGNYNFSADIDNNQVKTNDAFTLTETVSGSGSVDLIEMPRPVFPPDFEVYDPKITTSINADGLSGTKKAEFLVIPRHAGNFTIPAVEFSFYNPSSGNYTELRSKQFDIAVAKGSDKDDDGSLYATSQENITYLGSDIRHIMTGNAGLKAGGRYFFASPVYFILAALLLALFVALLLFVKKRAADRQNVTLMRNKKATKVAKGRLKNAYGFLKSNDQNRFYEEMSQALWGYISDKLSIERSVLSMATVHDVMVEKEVPEDLTNRFIDALNSCEYARFAPGDEGKKMDDLYQCGIEVITEAEKILK